MSTRKAINRVAAGGLKYKPIYTPPPPPPPPKQRPKLGPILIGGSLLYVTATYVSMLVFKSKNDTNDIVAGKTEKPSVTPATFDTSNVWESVAKKYDQEIGWDEVVMGVGLLRRWLIGKAKVSGSKDGVGGRSRKAQELRWCIGRCAGSIHRHRPQFRLLQCGSSRFCHVYRPPWANAERSQGKVPRVIQGQVPSGLLRDEQRGGEKEQEIRHDCRHVWAVFMWRSSRGAGAVGRLVQIRRLSGPAAGARPLALRLAEQIIGYKCWQTCATMGLLVESRYHGIVWGSSGQGEAAGRDGVSLASRHHMLHYRQTY